MEPGTALGLSTKMKAPPPRTDLSAQTCADGDERVKHALHCRFNGFFGKRLFAASIELNGEGKRLFVRFRFGLRTVKVEETEVRHAHEARIFARSMLDGVKEHLDLRFSRHNHRNVAVHRLELADGAVRRQRHVKERLNLKLEDDRRMRQLKVVRDARMNLADEADALLAKIDAGTAAGMKRWEGFANIAELKRRHKSFDVALDVVEVDRTRGKAPLRIGGRAVGKACNVDRLANALHLKRAVDDARVAIEDAGDFKNADAVCAAVEVVLENVDQAAHELRAHD